MVTLQDIKCAANRTAIATCILFGIAVAAASYSASSHASTGNQLVVDVHAGITSVQEEEFCKKISRVIYQAGEMRDADASVEDTNAYVAMVTSSLRPDTQQIMQGIAQSLYKPDLSAMQPDELAYNLYTNCKGHKDPAVTYSVNP